MNEMRVLRNVLLLAVLPGAPPSGAAVIRTGEVRDEDGSAHFVTFRSGRAVPCRVQRGSSGETDTSLSAQPFRPTVPRETCGLSRDRGKQYRPVSVSLWAGGRARHPDEQDPRYLVERVEDKLKRNKGVLPEVALDEYREAAQASDTQLTAN